MQTTRKFKTAAWMAAIGLSWVLGTPAHAKSNLTCTITDETGKPLEKEQMVLVSATTGKEKKEKTNGEGVVQFKGLDDDTYQIYGAIDGYVASKSLPITVSGNAEQRCDYTVPTVNYAQALLQEVMQLVQQKKYAEAEQRGGKAVEVLPGEGGAHYVLALSYAGQGKEEGAVKEIKMAAELSPDKFGEMETPVHLMALDVQANQSMENGDFDGAMQKYDAMQKVAPNDATVHYNKAIALGRQNKFDEALKAIDKAIEMKPQDAEFQQTKLRLQDMYLRTMEQKLEK